MRSLCFPLFLASVLLGAMLGAYASLTAPLRDAGQGRTTPKTQRFERPAWADADGDCQDTRAEVLATQCSAVTWGKTGCRVVKAVCIDAYTGAEVATDTASQALQIDHLVPASVAWKRGTWWHTREEMLRGAVGSRCTKPSECSAYLAFFNDRRNLNVTRARTNERKSDRMPDAWCPESPAVRPVIARQFRAVAAAYNVPLTSSELAGLQAWGRGACATGGRAPRKAQP